VDDGEEVGCRLLVASRDGAKALEAMEEALDHVPQPEELPVDTVLGVRWVRRDDGLHAPLFDSLADLARVVAGVSDEGAALGVLKELQRFSRFVRLPRSQRDVERLAFRVRDRVDFGRKASSRTAQSIASAPPFPPEASW